MFNREPVQCWQNQNQISSPTVELQKDALFQNQITVGASEISEGALPSCTSILIYVLSSP